MSKSYDPSKFINAAQVGGIEAYTVDEGPARNVRVLCVNTGGGLRYRVLVDRGLDIDQAFMHHNSLTLLSHKGLTPPTRGLDTGIDWLKSFGVGLLTSCGPFNTGGPANDAGENLGLHGPHSNTGAEIESVIQPRPHEGELDMSITGSVKYGRFFGPCVELRRTIKSTLGSNKIAITDEFYNAGNQDVPHAWLLHINLGYPLVDAGAELCFDETKVEPVNTELSQKHFAKGNNYKKIPAPLELHRGGKEFVAYVYPRSKSGKTTVGIINTKLNIGLAIRYDTRQFPRCGNWQHFGPHEYVTALEPMNGGVEGRDKDRAKGWLDNIPAGGKKKYQYEIEVVTDKEGLAELEKLNGK